MSNERTPEVVRHAEFAARLEVACEGNPHCPTDQYRGKQKWIYDNLKARFNISISPEACRKWFMGIAKPSPKKLSALAQLLEVDEAWLSLGIKPDLTPRERRQRNASAEGAVNVVAGLIQMNGGHIAFPEGAERGVDLFAIIGGKQRAFEIKMAFPLGAGMLRFSVSDQFEDHQVVGVVPTENPFVVRLLSLTPEVIRQHGERRGDFWELVVSERGENYKSGNDTLPMIRDLEGFKGIRVVA